MKYTEVKAMLSAIQSELGIPFTYYAFKEKETPNLPYITFDYPSSRNIPAGDTVYQRVDDLVITLYTKNKDFELEESVESFFATYHIVWDKTEDYLDTEHMFEITYETEIYVNGEQD